MVRALFGAVLGLFVFAGAAMADVEATVVSYGKGKLVVTVDGKERTIEIKGGHPHVHAADGKLLKGKEITAALKKDVKVDLEESDGKVVEVKIKQ